MSKTKIEWVINQDGTKGKTWNPVSGCTPISPGCAHCYAKRMAQRLAGRCGYPEAPHEFDVTLHPEKVGDPLRWKKPTRVFVCSMSDLFHHDVPFEFIKDVSRVMRACPQHTFQVLTKRPERMAEFAAAIGIAWPNVWLGVTAEDQEQADQRIPVLLQIPAAVRFVSIEPLLEPVDLSTIPYESLAGKNCITERRRAMSWDVLLAKKPPVACWMARCGNNSRRYADDRL